MASEWHEFGIRANSVSPGAVISERVIEKGARMSERAKASRDPGDTVIFTEPVELANAIFEYIEGFHNRRGRHSALGWATPLEFENTTRQQTSAPHR